MLLIKTPLIYEIEKKLKVNKSIQIYRTSGDRKQKKILSFTINTSTQEVLTGLPSEIQIEPVC